jgi:hypothetical protein
MMGGWGIYNPVTFADYVLVDDVRVSTEPKLVNEVDTCTAQSLDYIFLLEPSCSQSKIN